MSFDNPYHVQSAEDNVSGDHGSLAGILNELSMTRAWVRLMGIIGAIGAVLLMMSAIFSLVFGLAAGGGLVGVTMGLMYGVFACLYGYPFWRLLKYGSAITQAEQTASLADIETALGHQRAFWRFVGIATVIIIVFYLIAAVVLVLGFASLA
jgi:hypothetical protein